MNIEEQLEELLLRWEELAEAGQPASVEELCRACPELAGELQSRIIMLQKLNWLNDLVDSQATRYLPNLPFLSNHSIALVTGSEPVPGYRLEQRLGRGGFAEVWRASDSTGQLVALKFISWADGAAAIEGRALEVVADLRHPHLLSYLGAWQNAEYLVIAMELAERTMFERWQETRNQGEAGIPREELLGYFQQAAAALDYLHDRDIQHRDLKPQNLLLVPGAVKVGDFGLMRLLAHSVTKHTGNMTVAYAAPEFFEGQTTRFSDQYCLAVTYCQLRCGQLPFEGSLAQIMLGHLQGQPNLLPLPAEERPAVARALARKPPERWPSCTAFVQALQQSGPGKLPVLATQDRPGWRPWHIQRRWLLTGLSFLSLLVTVVLFGLPNRSEEKDDSVRPFEMLGPEQNVRCVVAGPIIPEEGRWVALTNGGFGPLLWDIDQGQVLFRLHPQGEGGPAAALAPFLIPEGLSGQDDGAIIRWNLRTGKEISRFTGHRLSVSSVAYSPDGQRILSGSADKTVRLWNRLAGTEIHRLEGHQSLVMSVAFDPTGRKAVSGGWDGKVMVWDLDKGILFKEMPGHGSKVWSVAYAPDGRHVLSGGEDRLVRLWAVDTGQLVREYQGHQHRIFSLSFLDYDRLISGGDQTARIWDLATGQELFRSPLQPSTVGSIWPFSRQDQAFVLLGTQRHGLRLWRVAKGKG